MNHDTKQVEAKARVERLKVAVRESQAQLKSAKDEALGKSHGANWGEVNRLTKVHRANLAQLAEAKVELVRLCGTSGSDPKWELIREAYHVLSDLQDNGVDIGEAGRGLLEDIEFHVPAAKLYQEEGAQQR